MVTIRAQIRNLKGKKIKLLVIVLIIQTAQKTLNTSVSTLRIEKTEQKEVEKDKEFKNIRKIIDK